MEQDISDLCQINSANCTKTYKRIIDKHEKPVVVINKKAIKRVPLSSKNALQFLLDGTLRSKVCRYCLNVTSPLSELDQVVQVANKGGLYKVSIKDMIATFHPFKVLSDPNFPERICEKCLNSTINAYLFAQQCERAERALRNCFDDMHDKLEKLDPLERPKKRGRQKLNPNYNKLYTEHQNVMDYADPIINIINISSEALTNETKFNELECAKCWQVLPNVQSLINHERTHPKTMWYSCRLCGKSFPKRYQLKRHHQNMHNNEKLKSDAEKVFTCRNCGKVYELYNEFLQHVETHKFKMIMEHVIERKMDELCSVCLDKSTNLTKLDQIVSLHGGLLELTGDKNLYSIVASTLPDMNTLHNYTGTKICVKCLNQAVNTYIFVNHFHFVRNRLNTCIAVMLNNLNQKFVSNNNLFIEISLNAVMPITEVFDDNLLVNENDFIDEKKLKCEVLEDEFREEIESEGSESDAKTDIDNKDTAQTTGSIFDDIIENPARNVTRTYGKNKLLNGFQTEKKDSLQNICSEFLTFKKKKSIRTVKPRYSCPLCMKQFTSDYFLKRHILKHVNRKMECKLCGDQFKSKFHLYEHTKIIHLLNTSLRYNCVTCGRSFLDYNKLAAHEKCHTMNCCQLCDKIFIKQSYYENHMQRHYLKLAQFKKKRVKTCSFCEKECANDNEFSLHVNKVHLQIKPYSCDMCDKQFYTEKNLINHKRVHNMYSKETCEFCNKVLRSRSQLVVHVRKHIGATPYQCHICCQSFYSQSKVRKHMRVCHGGRFCCKLCKIALPSKNRLKEHVIKTHNSF